MNKILVLGAGNIGSLIACMLAYSGDYKVYLTDLVKPSLPTDPKLPNLHFGQLDVCNQKAFANFVEEHNIQTLVSCLPYFFSITVAKYAKQYDLNYFDLTEDINVAEEVKNLAENSDKVFMPRCGLAPGFVNILAHDMMLNFTRLDTVELRVGNLPININNALQYALTWSTDGLINEYGNICYGLVSGQKMPLEPLEDLEVVEIDGLTYEAFNTSGGIGSLVDTYQDKVVNMNYKTIRYPGHCDRMRFLMKDLQLNDERGILKQILEKVLPKTGQDVALIYVAITGIKEERLINETYVNKIYPRRFLGREWTAIQVTTASGLCAVLDVILHDKENYTGLVLQEQLSLADILNNRFGKIFRTEEPAAMLSSL